jgi:hypothetical protein
LVEGHGLEVLYLGDHRDRHRVDRLDVIREDHLSFRLEVLIFEEVVLGSWEVHELDLVVLNS